MIKKRLPVMGSFFVIYSRIYIRVCEINWKKMFLIYSSYLDWFIKGHRNKIRYVISKGCT